MEKLRNQVSSAQKGSLPVLPPQAAGFKCGDLLILDRRVADKLKTPVHDGWFASTGENLSDLALDGLVFTQPEYVPTGQDEITCGSLAASELSVGFKAQVQGLFSAGAGGRKGRNEEVTVVIQAPSHANAIQELKPIVYNKEVMSRLFQNEVNWNQLFGNETLGVLAVVERSWAGDLQFVCNNGTRTSLFGSAGVPLPVSAPAALGAKASANGEGGANLGATGEATVGFNVFWFKAAWTRDGFCMSGPNRVILQADEDRLSEAVSWLMLTDLTFRDHQYGSATEGMTQYASYIAPQADDNVDTWQEVVNRGHAGMGLDVVGRQTQQGCFTVTSAGDSTDYSQARSVLVNHIASGNYGDQGAEIDDKAKNAPERRAFSQSVNFILSYSDEILSNIFDAMKKNGGSLDIGNGWLLTGMRLVVEFDMYKSGLLPVFLNSSVVVNSQVPTMVFRALGKGDFLLTPVEGVTDNGDGNLLNRTFGNGGCAGWKMVPWVQFLNPEDLDFDEKRLGLEREKYTAVRRSEGDIDRNLKPKHVKMVRYVLDPPQNRAPAAPAACREAVVIEAAAARQAAPASSEEAVIIEAATGPGVAANQEVDEGEAVAQSPALPRGGPSRLVPASPAHKKQRLGAQLKSVSEQHTEEP